MILPGTKLARNEVPDPIITLFETEVVTVPDTNVVVLEDSHAVVGGATILNGAVV